MADIIVTLLISIFVLQTVLVLACICTWIERKGSAMLQDRIGSNRSGTRLSVKKWWLKPLVFVIKILGIFGVVNTLFCDPIKAFFKEDFVPESGSKFLHTIAPFVAVLPAFLAFAVVPLAPEFVLPFYDKPILVQVARLDVGALLIIAMGGFATYGVMLAGWASNNKFSLLGGIRAASQLFSYELTLGVSLITMVVIYGTLDIYTMVEKQGEFLQWGVFKAPLACLILFIVGIAETKRAPFDLPEAESELVAGYLTEYSGMKFLLFWIGEFAEIGLISLIMSLLFFGGWNFPFLSSIGIDFSSGIWWQALIGHLILFFKVVFFCTLQIVIRWTLPRFRFDHLLELGWKVLLPLSIVNLLVTAAFIIW
ncbi:MAG: complex I subunit 1/NuoH family protein [Bdellovibrionota bacterium]|jgi:NADH-quinone oxidoreductase subunit H